MSRNNSYRFHHPRGVLIQGYVAGKHPLYSTHSHMLNRCFNDKCNQFHNYGGRGITVCKRWLSFENFVIDMGKRPTHLHTLECIDNELGYNPENCVWATRTTQCVNRRIFESNTSGFTGVKKVKNSSKLLAVFDFEGVRYTVGRFDTLSEAALARTAYVEGFIAAKGGSHERI